MDVTTDEPIPVDAAPEETGPVPRPATAPLLAVAWIATLLVSRLPEIVLRDVLRVEVPWMPWAVLAIAAALWVVARALPAFAPLHGYFAVMTALAALLVIIPLIFGSTIWRSIVPDTTHPAAALLAERVFLALLVPVMIGALAILGTRPREAYLRVGNLRGPTSRRGGGDGMPWTRFGPIMIVFLVLITGWMSGPILKGSIDVGAALPFIGLGAIAALLNAFWEEIAFRAAPLSQLQKVVGPSTGVLIVAVWFGLGHYYGGIPNGPFGALASGAIALLLGRAMIETKGLAWPLALHFAVDFVIYTFLALASTAT